MVSIDYGEVFVMDKSTEGRGQRDVDRNDGLNV